MQSKTLKYELLNENFRSLIRIKSTNVYDRKTIDEDQLGYHLDKTSRHKMNIFSWY